MKIYVYWECDGDGKRQKMPRTTPRDLMREQPNVRGECGKVTAFPRSLPFRVTKF